MFIKATALVLGNNGYLQLWYEHRAKVTQRGKDLAGEKLRIASSSKVEHEKEVDDQGKIPKNRQS